MHHPTATNRSLPIYNCGACYLNQPFRGQTHCIHCGAKIPCQKEVIPTSRGHEPLASLRPATAAIQ